MQSNKTFPGEKDTSQDLHLDITQKNIRLEPHLGQNISTSELKAKPQAPQNLAAEDIGLLRAGVGGVILKHEEITM